MTRDLFYGKIMVIMVISFRKPRSEDNLPTA